MYVVTGGAGFIGSNIIIGLNRRGIENIVVVDDLSDGKKCLNLADLNIADYIDKDDFFDALRKDTLPFKPQIIFHEGACSATTEWDGKYIMSVNYEYSKAVLDFCVAHKIPLSYASSASVYGGSSVFREDRVNERPMNMYAYSKFLFDQQVSRRLANASSQIVGFRYFNVYGPRESHKGDMASVALHLRNQVVAGGNPKLFGAYDGYEAGGQSRDFIYVEDVVDAKLWFMDNPQLSGIFNLGTGKAEPFRTIAETVIEYFQKGEIEYMEFPESLKGAYQSFTQADIQKLRAVGYRQQSRGLAQGVKDYLKWLDAHG
ncbi:MAG: ADP-L-glycero-D-manno-heptose 6-epimerase [Cellvibrionaceae bacterium]|jgi:ADP-L-glycero-D-manno-heptose 6-epimerase